MKRIFIVFIVALISMPAWSGWEVTYKDAESGERSKEYYANGKANFGQIVYTGKHFLVVDAGSKAYWKGTPEQYCEALLSQKKKMEVQMASLPAQYRPVPISKKKVTRKKIGTQKITGYSATGYDFSVDGEQAGQIWVSSDSGLSDIIKSQRAMAKKMKCLDEMDGSSVESSALYKQTIDDAFPMKEDFRQVVSVEKKSVPDKHFTEPAGYRSFSSYDQFMNHLMNRSGSSNTASQHSAPSYDMPTERSQTQASSTPGSEVKGQQEENVLVKDAREIADDAVDEAHQSTKQGIQDEVSKDIQKGVKGFLDKLF